MTHFPDLFHRVVDGGNTALNEFDLEVSRGNVYGVTHVDVRGRAVGVAAGLVEVWEPASGYVFPTSSLALSLSSSDANDAYSGQGMRSVEINGLGERWEAYSETVHLSGTAIVTTTGSFLRVNHVHCGEAGTLRGNAGDIRTHHGPRLMSLMASGSGHDGNGIYTVPSGSRAYIRAIYCNTGRDSTLRWRVAFKTPGHGMHTVRDIENYRTHQRFDVYSMSALTSGTDLIISAQRADGANAMTVTAGAFLYLVSDEAGTR